MPRMSVVPLGMSTRTVHLNSCGISPVRHMCCTISTRHIQRSVCRGVFEFSPGYTSRRHCLKCYARSWACPPALSRHKRRTTVSTSASDGVLSFTWTGSKCVAMVRPGGCGSYLWYRVWKSPLTFSISVQEGLGARRMCASTNVSVWCMLHEGQSLPLKALDTP